MQDTPRDHEYRLFRGAYILGVGTPIILLAHRYDYAPTLERYIFIYGHEKTLLRTATEWRFSGNRPSQSITRESLFAEELSAAQIQLVDWMFEKKPDLCRGLGLTALFLDIQPTDDVELSRLYTFRGFDAEIDRIYEVTKCFALCDTLKEICSQGKCSRPPLDLFDS